MSIATTTSLAQYTGDGTTTVFPIPFPFFDPTDILVTLDGVSQGLNSVFTVSGGVDSTGNVTFLSAPANGVAIVIDRYTPPIQPYNFRAQGTYFAKQHESAMDRIILALQDLADMATIFQTLYGALIYDLVCYANDVPNSAAIMARWHLARKVVFPSSLTGSKASSGVAATGSTVLTIKKNGVSVGTITFGAGSSTGVYASSGFTALIGDIITLEAPVAQDATLAQISVTIGGTRIP